MVVRSLRTALRRALRIVVAAAAGSLAVAAAADAPAHAELSGQRVALALANGERALVVHFWATWCGSCALELPIVVRAAAQCAPQGVRVRIVAAGESAEAVQEYQSRHALAFEALLDPHGRAWRAAGGFGLPANWLRTSEGDRLLPGPRSPAQWTELLGTLGCAFEPGRTEPPAAPR